MQCSQSRSFRPFLSKTYKFQNKLFMYTTYHLTSAQEVREDILDAIRVTFKSKPITIIVEEDESDFELTNEMKTISDEKLEEDLNTYIDADEFINQLVLI